MLCSLRALLVVLSVVVAVSIEAQTGWKPAATPLTTRWARDVEPKMPRPEYPRPQMKRERWQNLNGLWEYAVTNRAATSFPTAEGQILVPFAIESSLSGVGRRVTGDNLLWYRRSVAVPPEWKGGRLLLHFGAVDWRSEVFVNGIKVGEHEGGFDPFSFDITDALRTTREQEIVVKVWDSTGDGQARGKQLANPHGIFYTPVTGIWQTVWLEPVPTGHIAGIRVTPNAKKGEISVDMDAAGDADQFQITVLDRGREIGTITTLVSKSARISLSNPNLWTPDSPYLYDLRVDLLKDRKVVDTVDSYFAMRDVRVGPDSAGITRIFLNDKVTFMAGPLDQGYWPDGLLTAPTFEAMKYDLDVTKRLGFNTVRKHVKVEPATWYRLCDEMGLIVWQDMPSAWHGKDGPSPAVAKQFELEWKRIMDALYHFPSLVMWVPFNEGWGQYDTVRVTEWTMQYDPSRIVNSASGWTDFGVGHVNDIHVYPGPDTPKKEAKRAGVLGEFGGLGFPMTEHLWNKDGNWGYVSYKTSRELTDAAIDLFRMCHLLTGDRGLSAIIYTQTTDVEIEVNGLLTYDRAKMKFDEPALAAAIRELYKAPPKLDVIIPTSVETPQEWFYTTTDPGEGWNQAGANRTGWKRGQGGFGTPQTPNTTVRTRWDTSNIWVAREIEVGDTSGGSLFLSIYHDEDAKVYLDGKLVADLKGYVTSYRLVALSSFGELKPGRHTLAIHVRQTTGGQYIDAGIVRIRP